VVLHAIADCESRCITIKEWSINGVVVSEQEERQHGKDVVVPVPMRFCPDCQRVFFHHPFAGWLPLATVLSAILGVGLLLFFGLTLIGLVGILLLALAGLFYVVPAWIMRKEQQALKRWLRKTPLYAQLLAEYPDAIIYIAEGEGP
jgi:hypothetical protein